MGAQAPGSTQYDYPVLARALFGMKFKVITGYEATPKIHLAMERGEVHGTSGQLVDAEGDQPAVARDKKIKIIAQWALRTHPEMPDVPMVLDVAKTEAEKRGARPGAGAARISAGRSSCRRACRRSAWQRCGARSTPP